jgi:hypothetical protein
VLQLRDGSSSEGVDGPGTQDAREGGCESFAQANPVRVLQAVQDWLPLRGLLHLLRQGMPEAGRVRLQGRALAWKGGGGEAERAGPDHVGLRVVEARRSIVSRRRCELGRRPR